MGKNQFYAIQKIILYIASQRLVVNVEGEQLTPIEPLPFSHGLMFYFIEHKIDFTYRRTVPVMVFESAIDLEVNVGQMVKEPKI